jgi:hypothetical protein
LKQFDQAQGAGFVLSGMLTVSSNVGKPQGDECSSH